MIKGMSKKVISLVIVGSFMMGVSAQAADIKKDESVYVNLDNGGTTQSIIVSDWLHSKNGKIKTENYNVCHNIKNIQAIVV